MGINWNNINRSCARSSRRVEPDPGYATVTFAEYRVSHEKFGQGTAVARNGDSVTVEFDDGVSRRIRAEYLVR